MLFILCWKKSQEFVKYDLCIKKIYFSVFEIVQFREHIVLVHKMLLQDVAGAEATLDILTFKEESE